MKEVIIERLGGASSSSPDAPSFSAQVEAYQDCLPELQQYYPLHWRELALNQDRFALDPDYAKYDLLDATGKLILVTLRQAGRLVGYFIGIVDRELHYMGSLALTMDIFFTSPEIRGRTAGLRLFRTVIAEAKRRGVTRLFFGSKLHKDSGRLFKAIGMKPVETWYSMTLGGA